MRSTLNSLQVGRALAALSVAAFHLSVEFAPGTSMLADLTRQGHAGVNFFFALSGFIILHAHGKDIGCPTRAWRYITNRFTRVYPVYWVYTTIFVAAVIFTNGSTKLPDTIYGWLSTVLLLRFSDDPTPLSVAWTLYYEVGFYLTFAILIINRRAGVISMAAWGATILILHQVAPRTSPTGVWTSLLGINFFVGMGACWAYQRLSPRLGLVPLSTGVAGLLLVAAYVNRGMSETVFTLAVALSCGAIILGASTIERSHKISMPILTALGNASYTLYLVHQHVQGLIREILLRVGLAERLPADVLFLTVIAFGATAAYCIHRLVEVPLIALLRQKRRSAVPADATIDNRRTESETS
ncbi:MAG TPA: acyltransferase [Phenylobacterium sp.]|uniref:acyltransferase family protein n=1 Tax=Phenylobacterium sp. TaxID=1871053 RepID=UPI002F939D94